MSTQYEHLIPAVRQVAVEVLESLTFTLESLDDEEPGASSEPLAVAGVAFDGPYRGELHIGFAKNILPIVSANMLGLDDGVTPSDEKQRDAFKEVLNVVCGNLLPVLAGTEAEFQVKPPQYEQRTDFPNAQAGQSEVRVSIRLEEGPVELVLLADTAFLDAADDRLKQVPIQQTDDPWND